MKLDKVREDILLWSENFLEIPNPKLGDWAPCPFARRARLNSTIDIRVGSNPTEDLKSLSISGFGPYEVVVIAYNPLIWPHEKFGSLLKTANKEFLIPNDMFVLEDHPDDVEITNGVIMNQGKYALAMCNILSELNSTSRMLASKGYYDHWTDGMPPTRPKSPLESIDNK